MCVVVVVVSSCGLPGRLCAETLPLEEDKERRDRREHGGDVSDCGKAVVAEDVSAKRRGEDAEE